MANANVRNSIMLSAPADSLSDEEFYALMAKNYSLKKGNSAKSLAPLFILEILKRFSSPEKHLTQAQIKEKLYRHFEVTIERQAVSRSLNALQDYGYGVCFGRNGAWYDEQLQRALFE